MLPPCEPEPLPLPELPLDGPLPPLLEPEPGPPLVPVAPPELEPEADPPELEPELPLDPEPLEEGPNCPGSPLDGEPEEEQAPAIVASAMKRQPGTPRPR